MVLQAINKIDYHHWFVSYKNKKIGWICITEPNFKIITYDGDIILEKVYVYWRCVPCYLYNFIFKNLNFENILAETLEHNNMVAEILRLHGFKKTESINSKIKGKDKITIRNNYKLSKFDWQKIISSIFMKIFSFTKK